MTYQDLCPLDILTGSPFLSPMELSLEREQPDPYQKASNTETKRKVVGEVPRSVRILQVQDLPIHVSCRSPHSLARGRKNGDEQPLGLLSEMQPSQGSED